MLKGLDDEQNSNPEFVTAGVQYDLLWAEPVPGIMPGTSTRNDVERILGQPLRTVPVASATLFEYKPPAGIAKVEVGYKAASSVVERIRVHFAKPISRAALLRTFKLPQQSDAKRTDAEGKLVEFFGGQAFLVMTYAASDVDSGVSRVAYCSRELFDLALNGNSTGRSSTASTSPVSGRWSGSWTNNKGEAGSSTIRLIEGPNGAITGDEDGWQIEDGRRAGNALTWEYRNQNEGCRNYKVSMWVSADGRSINGTYEVTDRCERQSYTGRYGVYARQ